MDLLNDLAGYLIENNIGKVIGEDIWLDFTPDEGNQIIVLSEYSGPKTQIKVDAYQRRVQIKVRDKDAENCKALIWSIFNLLNDVEKDNEVLTTSGRAMVTHPLQVPFRLTIDEMNRFVYAYNLSIATTND